MNMCMLLLTGFSSSSFDVNANSALRFTLDVGAELFAFPLFWPEMKDSAELVND